MPLSARAERRAWGAGAGVDGALANATADTSPIRPLSALNQRSSPRTPRHQKAIQEATSVSGSSSPPAPGAGYIGAAMASIMHEEWYRAREYPETAHITPTLMSGADSTPRARRSVSPTRDIQGMLGRDVLHRHDITHLKSVIETFVSCALVTDFPHQCFPAEHLRLESADFQSPVIDHWLQRIFSAKCLDLRLKPSDQRCDRFMHTGPAKSVS
jgi:hypothetical protein